MKFTLANWAVLAGYVGVVTVIGSLFYRKRTSASEYFLGGKRMSVVPVAISLVAADLSAISTMGSPAWTFKHNLELFLGSATYLIAAPIVMYLFLPFYSKFSFYTGYEYLERRFDVRVRLLGSGLFLFTRGVHVAIVIYAPALVLSLITGISLVGCVLIVGAFTTLYTTLGGLKAVIWTDVMQFSVLVTGIAVVFWFVSSRVPGGAVAVFHLAGKNDWLRAFDFSLNLHKLTTVWAMVLGSGTLVLSQLGTDQAYLQRYFSTRSLKEGRRAVMLDAMIVVPVSGVLLLLGTFLRAYYLYNPSKLHGLPYTDAILPFFVVTQLPGIFAGFVIASIFAASMAVMSAGINSLSTVTTVDFYDRLRHRGEAGGSVAAGRIATVGWGAAATVAALFANRLGPLMNAFSLASSFVAGPILGIFLLGMLTKRATGTATISGAIAGLASVSIVAIECSISFFYFAFIGLVTTLVVGYVLSMVRAPSADANAKDELVFQWRRKRSSPKAVAANAVREKPSPGSSGAS